MQMGSGTPATTGLEFEDVLALVAHDMRTSLMVIGGLAGTLRVRADLIQEPDRDESLQTIERHVDLLASFAEDILDVVRIAAGRLELDRRSLCAADLLASAMKQARTEHRDHEFSSVVLGEDLAFCADKRRIQQVLSNLIGNAALSAPKGSTIEVGAGSDDSCALFSVSNTGGSIAPELTSQLFERFPHAKQHTGGIGLGLYLCRRIVESHGGRIWAHSESGRTIFRFSIPKRNG